MKFFYLLGRVIGQHNTQTTDCGLQTGGNMQGWGGGESHTDGVLAILKQTGFGTSFNRGLTPKGSQQELLWNVQYLLGYLAKKTMHSI